jgi:hypothetical protein
MLWSTVLGADKISWPASVLRKPAAWAAAVDLPPQRPRCLIRLGPSKISQPVVPAHPGDLPIFVLECTLNPRHHYKLTSTPIHSSLRCALYTRCSPSLVLFSSCFVAGVLHAWPTSPFAASCPPWHPRLQRWTGATAASSRNSSLHYRCLSFYPLPSGSGSSHGPPTSTAAAPGRCEPRLFAASPAPSCWNLTLCDRPQHPRLLTCPVASALATS